VSLQAKICGITTPEAMAASIVGGARFVGLVFYPKSPRYVAPALAADLARGVPTGVRVVGLFVDPEDEELEHVLSSVPLDMIQLHGAETPARVAEIRGRFLLPIVKAVAIAEPADLDRARFYEGAADRLLFDAKPPKNVTALPGGNGIPFDWSLLAGQSWAVPWMLSGGLTAANLATAVAATRATAVDVSSGVEDRPGHKDPALVSAFLAEAARL
jgi:phosphoribosylanthranilate isomerase